MTCHILTPFRYSVIEYLIRKLLSRYGKNEPRGLSCKSTLNICQDVFKSANLQQKQGFAYSQESIIVINLKLIFVLEYEIKRIYYTNIFCFIQVHKILLNKIVPYFCMLSITLRQKSMSPFAVYSFESKIFILL